MEYFNSPNVFYLEPSDFVNNRLTSRMINPMTGKPYFDGITVIMIQGVYCGYCTKFKPHFQAVANSMCKQGFEFATIQTDGKDGPIDLESILGEPIMGVPLVVKFFNGIPIAKYTGPHDAESLSHWITEI